MTVSLDIHMSRWWNRAAYWVARLFALPYRVPSRFYSAGRLLPELVIQPARALAARIVDEPDFEQTPVTRCPCGHLMRWTSYHATPGYSTHRKCQACDRGHSFNMR